MPDPRVQGQRGAPPRIHPSASVDRSARSGCRGCCFRGWLTRGRRRRYPSEWRSRWAGKGQNQNHCRGALRAHRAGGNPPPLERKSRRPALPSVRGARPSSMPTWTCIRAPIAGRGFARGPVSIDMRRRNMSRIPRADRDDRADRAASSWTLPERAQWRYWLLTHCETCGAILRSAENVCAECHGRLSGMGRLDVPAAIRSVLTRGRGPARLRRKVGLP